MCETWVNAKRVEAVHKFPAGLSVTGDEGPRPRPVNPGGRVGTRVGITSTERSLVVRCRLFLIIPVTIWSKDFFIRGGKPLGSFPSPSSYKNVILTTGWILSGALFTAGQNIDRLRAYIYTRRRLMRIKIGREKPINTQSHPPCWCLFRTAGFYCCSRIGQVNSLFIWLLRWIQQDE